MQLKLLGVEGNESFKMVTAVIKGMTAEQATATVSTTALTAVQKAAALATAGMSDADIVATLVKKNGAKPSRKRWGF